MKRIEDTPWYLAAALPSRLLSVKTGSVLRTLAMLQLPMVVLLLVSMMVALRKLIVRLNILRSNVLSLSAGDAALTRPVPINGQDEVDDISKAVNRFLAYLHGMISDLATSSNQIAKEIDSLRQQSSHSNSILERHANETDQAVTAITEMSSTADAVAHSATETASFTQLGCRRCRRGRCGRRAWPPGRTALQCARWCWHRTCLVCSHRMVGGQYL